MGLFRERNHGLNQGWNCTSSIYLIVRVVNDVPIKNHLKKWLSIPHITMGKNSLKVILCELTSNINLKVLWAYFSVDSLLQKLESVAVSKKNFLVLILAFPLIFIAVGKTAYFHNSRDLLFSYDLYMWLFSAKHSGKNVGLNLIPQESVKKTHVFTLQKNWDLEDEFTRIFALGIDRSKCRAK